MGEAGSPAAMESCHPWSAKWLLPFIELPFATDNILLVYKQLEKQNWRPLGISGDSLGKARPSSPDFPSDGMLYT